MNTASFIAANIAANRRIEPDWDDLDDCGEMCSHCDERYTLWDAVNLLFGLVLFAAFVFAISHAASSC